MTSAIIGVTKTLIIPFAVEKIIAARIVPLILPNPPNITMRNAAIIILRPIVWVTVVIGAASAPANPARAHPKINTIKDTLFVFIPSEIAISLSCLVALTCMPSLVLLRKYSTPPTTTIETNTTSNLYIG